MSTQEEAGQRVAPQDTLTERVGEKWWNQQKKDQKIVTTEVERTTRKCVPWKRSQERISKKRICAAISFLMLLRCRLRIDHWI